MFLHIGEGALVPLRDIVAILDCRILPPGDEPGWLGELHPKNAVDHADAGAETKSIVLTADRAYLSPISPLTLKQRAANPLGASGASIESNLDEPLACATYSDTARGNEPDETPGTKGQE